MNAPKLANIITALLDSWRRTASGEQGFVDQVKDKEVHVLMEGKWFSVCVKEMDAEDLGTE